MDHFLAEQENRISSSPESRAQAVSLIQALLHCELAAPEPSSTQVDINARVEISEAMLHIEVMSDNLSEQVETLEAVGTADDLRQLKLQRLMHLVDAAPSRPSWEDPCLQPPPPVLLSCCCW